MQNQLELPFSTVYTRGIVQNYLNKQADKFMDEYGIDFITIKVPDDQLTDFYFKEVCQNA